MGLWHAFLYDVDWSPVATFLTGAFAVGGAVYVGLRQVSISRQQLDLSARQVRLQDMAVRVAIFERRLAVYEATRDYLLYILKTAGPPEQPVHQAFLQAWQESRFLFRAAVPASLEAISQTAGRYLALKSEGDATFAREGNYGPRHMIDEKFALFATIGGYLEGLTELFGDELRLEADD